MWLPSSCQKSDCVLTSLSQLFLLYSDGLIEKNQQFPLIWNALMISHNGLKFILVKYFYFHAALCSFETMKTKTIWKCKKYPVKAFGDKNENTIFKMLWQHLVLIKTKDGNLWSYLYKNCNHVKKYGVNRAYLAH